MSCVMGGHCIEVLGTDMIQLLLKVALSALQGVDYQGEVMGESEQRLSRNQDIQEMLCETNYLSITPEKFHKGAGP